jgi:hypothetical protein
MCLVVVAVVVVVVVVVAVVAAAIAALPSTNSAHRFCVNTSTNRISFVTTNRCATIPLQQVLQLQALASEHVSCATELATLRDKAARSYARQRDAIGLTEAARRTADTPAVTETLQMFEYAAALYEEQAACHVALATSVRTDRPHDVDVVDAAWDSAIHRNAHLVSRMLRETTSVERGTKS